MAICDNGSGFQDSSQGWGQGIANMRARAIELGAELQIESGCEGTCVVLSLPRDQESSLGTRTRP